MIHDHLDTSSLHFDPESRLWLKRLKPDTAPFSYSDGDAAEQYLQASVAAASDIGSESFELECKIRDWPSEYHLTRRRAQLLANFVWNRDLHALEIGAGCGAITRFLGETLRAVISVEGSQRRAHIARTRTRDLEHVEVVCAPFQELKVRAKFDVVFVIGVLEYAAAFGQAEADPYDAFLARCADCLTDTGVLVLAIENQFGLKYFAGMGEDHTAQRFDGLEGYASQKKAARTFGKAELSGLLSRYFSRSEYYYPFPDYKVPSAVLSDAALSELGAHGNAGLISGFPMRDYVHVSRKASFDEALAWTELSRNRLAAAFAPSFLIVAGKPESRLPTFRELAVLYSAERKPEFQTVTRIERGPRGELQSRKSLRSREAALTSGPLTLRSTLDAWIDQPSLAMQLRRRRRLHGVSLTSLFEPCAAWFDWLRGNAGSADLSTPIDGSHLDNIWKNTFIVDGRCVFIDQEWCWHQPFNPRVLIIRSAYDFIFDRARLTDGVPALERSGGATLISEIAHIFAVELTGRDFADFIQLESQLRETVFGKQRARERRAIAFKLAHPRLAGTLKDFQRLARSELNKGLVARVPWRKRSQ